MSSYLFLSDISRHPPEVTNRLEVVHVQTYTPSYLPYYWELWHLDGTWNPLLSLSLSCPRTDHQYRPGSQWYGGSQLLPEPVRPSQEQPHPEPLRPAACPPEPLSQPQPHPAQPQPPTARQPHQLTALDRPAPRLGAGRVLPFHPEPGNWTFFFFLLNHWVQMNIHRTQGDVLFEPLFIYLCVCVCERGESLVHAAIRLLHCCLIFYHCIISKLFWAVSVPVNTTYLCCIVNSRSSTKISLEGIYTFVCTQVYLFFWYADLFVFFDTSQVRRWKVEDDRRRKAKWLSYSCKFFLSETVS